MRIVFIGAVKFSKKMLQKLVCLNADIVGVATMQSSSFNSDFVDLTPVCNENAIPYKYISNINSQEVIEWIKELNADIIFCFGWSRLLKKELLESTPMGVVGCHPALLPANRGRHPLIWALVLGLEQTASTFFFMDESADSGKILSQRLIDIYYEDDAKSLYEKITLTSEKQIEEFLPLLINKSYNLLEQDHSKANTWRKRGKIDGQIDWRMSSRAIYNLVRALVKPYPGAHAIYKGEEYKIWKIREVEVTSKNIESGKVISSTKNAFTIKVYDKAVEILEHEFPHIPVVGEYL